MANNEIYKSLTPENARFVAKQDTSMFVPKAGSTKRYGLVLYSTNDFLIDSLGRLKLALPKTEQVERYDEIYGDLGRDGTVLGDPTINLSTLAAKDTALNQKIDSKVSALEGEIRDLDSKIDDEIEDREYEVDRLDARLDNELEELDSKFNGEVEGLDLKFDGEVDRLDEKIDLIIQDALPYNDYSTYSSLKISELINDARLQGLHFVGYIGSTVGKNYDDEDIGVEGNLWHVDSGTTSPIIEGSWDSSTMYIFSGGSWIPYGSDYIPEDFAIWKSVNTPDETVNAWFFIQGIWEVLDFNVDIGNYYTKNESDALFKTQSDFDDDMLNYYTKDDTDDLFKTIDDFNIDMMSYYDKEESDERFKQHFDDDKFKSNFEYGNYLSESTENEIQTLNIDNMNIPTSGLLTSFVQGFSTINADNVEDAIKTLDGRPILKSIDDIPSREGDYAVGDEGIYKSVLFSEAPLVYAWEFVTTDLSSLLPRDNANYDFITSLSFLNDDETGYLLGRANLRNINSGVTASSDISVPVATSETDGIMPYTAMQALADLDNRMIALESGTISYFIDFGSDNPTQEYLSGMWASKSGSPLIPNLARLIDVIRNMYFEYYENEDAWDGPYTFRYGTGGIGLLGLVSSSEQSGQIYIEPVTGIMSLNGYTSIMATLNSLYNDDIEGATINVNHIPNLSAAKITSGIFDIARIPNITVAKGGTGVTTFAQNRLIFTGSVDGASLRDGAEFGALNTILVSNGVSELPNFKTLQSVGGVVTGDVNQTIAGNKTLTGETIISGYSILKLFELKNQDPVQYSRMMFTGSQKQFTLGVGNHTAGITELRNKFYVYDYTTGTPIFYGDQSKMKFSGRVGVANAIDNDDAVNKSQLDDLEAEVDTKVDKVEGKGLSTNDYTTPEKTKLASLENYDDTAITSALANKVDKVAGKQLSTEDYTSTEKSKLAGIQAGAQVNAVTSVAGRTGAVTVTKTDVGLGNVNNTSDQNKPISNATQAALNTKQSKLQTVVDEATAETQSLANPDNFYFYEEE